MRLDAVHEIWFLAEGKLACPKCALRFPYTEEFKAVLFAGGVVLDIGGYHETLIPSPDPQMAEGKPCTHPAVKAQEDREDTIELEIEEQDSPSVLFPVKSEAEKMVSRGAFASWLALREATDPRKQSDGS